MARRGGRLHGLLASSDRGEMAQARRSWIGVGLFSVFRLAWASLVVLAPTLGVWVASSLAAYRNGPVWLACAAGLLLFPVLPVLWDMVVELLRRRKARPQDRRVLTRWDRIVLRTLAINLVFLGGLLWARPEAAFTALSTRGDWFLEHVRHPLAEQARPWLFRAADGLQWLYEAAHDNHYAEMVEAADRPAETPTPRTGEWGDPWEKAPEAAKGEAAGGEAGGGSDVPKDSAGEAVPGDRPAEAAPPTTAWPSPAEVHPAVTAMPAETKASVAAVGLYLKAQEPDPGRRVKAIHDFVATHLAYDADAYLAGRYPDQRAEAVLTSGLAVCAGYANLMKAIAEVTGDEVVVVVGDARGLASEVDGEPHAWNAAKIDGLWYLIDATWDSGHLKDRKFVREYSTSYLFVPPALIGITHFPEAPAWQLRETPLSRGEFARQPMMRPQFFADKMTLEEPQRSQVTVQRDFLMRLTNPRKRFVSARAFVGEAAEGSRCAVTGREQVEIRCSGLAPGTYNVRVFSSPVEFGVYQFVGEVQVHAAG